MQFLSVTLLFLQELSVIFNYFYRILPKFNTRLYSYIGSVYMYECVYINSSMLGSEEQTVTGTHHSPDKSLTSNLPIGIPKSIKT